MHFVILLLLQVFFAKAILCVLFIMKCVKKSLIVLPVFKYIFGILIYRRF
jgi:hypothetical protein